MTATEALIDARHTSAYWQATGVREVDIAPQLLCEPNWLAIETNIALRLMRGRVVPPPVRLAA